MNEFSNLVNSEITKMNSEIRAVHLQADLNQLFIYILTTLQSVYSHITEYFTIINSLQQHRLHPLIIDPKTLLDTYAEITKRNHLAIVDFHLLNQIIKVQFVQHEGDVFIKISVPLLEEEEYAMNKVHLLPIRNSVHNTLLDLDTNIILNGTQENHFISMSNEEFRDNCLKCNSRKYPTIYICAQKQIKVIGAERKNCIFSLLYNPAEIHKTCNYRILDKPLEFLVKLVRPNAWLFSFESPRSLLSHCEKITSHKEINGTGILQLDQHCKYTLETIEIPYEGNTEIKLPFHQPKSLTVPSSTLLHKFVNTLAVNKSLPKSITIPPLWQTHHNYNNNLKLNSKSIDEFKAELSEVEKERKIEMQTVQTHVNSSTLGLMAIGIIILAISFFKRNRSNKNIPKTINQVLESPELPISQTTSSNLPKIQAQELPISQTTSSNFPKIQVEEHMNPSQTSNTAHTIIPVPPPLPTNLLGTTIAPKKDLKERLNSTVACNPHKSFRIKI